MRYLVLKPDTPLGGFVDYLWSLSDAPRHLRERIVPSGTIELVVNLAEDEFRIHAPSRAGGCWRRLPGALVSGCYGAAFEIDTRNHADVVGVHFRPGGAARILGVAAGEIADTHVGLESLWGRTAIDLRERLCSASAARGRFQILEQALSACLARRRGARDAVKQALSELDRPGIEVGGVARDLGLSRRRFIEVFTEDVGMTPKRYSRVRRFQRALALAIAGDPPTWAELSLECGYFDQAHLCRDWAELTGVSPAEFVALRRNRVKENHLALPEQGSNPSRTPA